MRRLKLFLLAIIILAALTACSSSASQAPAEMAGLKISLVTTAMGGDDPNYQKLSYSVALRNDTGASVYVRSLEPILSKEAEGRVIVSTTNVSVQKLLDPGAFIEIRGEIPLDTRNVSKQVIQTWEPLITSVRVSYDQTLPVPGVLPTP